MGFEVIAAFVVGALLPVLEAYLRGIGHWRGRFHNHVRGLCRRRITSDRRVGVVSGAALGRDFPLAGVGFVAGLMGGSLWSQLEETLRNTASEPDRLASQ